MNNPNDPNISNDLFFIVGVVLALGFFIYLVAQMYPQ